MRATLLTEDVIDDEGEDVAGEISRVPDEELDKGTQSELTEMTDDDWSELKSRAAKRAGGGDAAI